MYVSSRSLYFNSGKCFLLTFPKYPLPHHEICFRCCSHNFIKATKLPFCFCAFVGSKHCDSQNSGFSESVSVGMCVCELWIFAQLDLSLIWFSLNFLYRSQHGVIIKPLTGGSIIIMLKPNNQVGKSQMNSSLRRR